MIWRAKQKPAQKKAFNRDDNFSNAESAIVKETRLSELLLLARAAKGNINPPATIQSQNNSIKSRAPKALDA
jgi:hypothetical protein